METNYQPLNPVATFTDKYGEEQIIHRPRGQGLRMYKGHGTTTLKMNRAAAVLIGQRIKIRRKELGMSQRQLCEVAGFKDVSPKHRIYAIENATRGQGVRIGTLYSLAYALECEPFDLMPSIDVVVEAAGVQKTTLTALR